MLLNLRLTPEKNVKKQKFEHCDISSKVSDLWKVSSHCELQEDSSVFHREKAPT